MNTILEQFKDKINGTFAFFDRMIIKGHIRQFFSASGKGFFLSEQNVLLKDFSAYANQVTSDIVAHVEKMAEETHRPLRYLTSAKIPKEQTAMEILKDDPVEEGLVCILSVVEYCQTLQPIKNRDGRLELRSVDRKCKYYYLYYLDKHFGFMHVKLQTWFPFLIQVYINGREMMKHVFDENGITYKMYDKFSCLRVEMTINDPREFKVYKDVHHQDGTVSKRWVPMGKSISNLYRYAEVSKAANRRFLDSLQGIVPAGSIEREINEVCGKRTVRGKTVTGYNVWSKETMQLFETISDGKYLIRGFTNKDIRSILYPQSQSDKKVRGKMSRTLSKLRAHGLIRKIPHSRKYLVTDKGRRIMGALIETKRKLYPDLAAS